jgi:hypothetical protein
MTTEPALQKINKGIQYTEEEGNETREVQKRINLTRQVD